MSLSNSVSSSERSAAQAARSRRAPTPTLRPRADDSISFRSESDKPSRSSCLVSFFVFFVINVIPGDPTLNRSGEFATPEQREIARANSTDSIADVRPIRGLADRTLSGDLGRSLHSNERVWPCGRPSAGLARVERPALTIALLIGLPCGILAALRRGTTVDNRQNRDVLAITLGVPYFWLGVLLILPVRQSFSTCCRPPATFLSRNHPSKT